MSRQGYKVINTSSSHWFEASPRVYQAFPYHSVIQPGEEELSTLLRQNQAIALRYSTPIDNSLGCISYHAVIDKHGYALEGLDRRSRQNIRTGLKNCSVEAISLQRLAEEGWTLEQDTVNRQQRQVESNRKTWYRRYMAAVDLPGFEAWGALVNGRLVASLLTFQYGDCCEFISQQCHRDFLNIRVNNALTFVVTQTINNRPGVQSIFYTLQSLDAPPSVDEFKFRMGYSAKPLRQRVVFHQLIQNQANKITHAILLKLLKRNPSSRFFAKAEGMLRFYCQGLRPLKDQEWPSCLAEAKEKLLGLQDICQT
ncbi:hypothetical protein SAMN04489760_1158 [Syntrophus gentianae]|uniref:Acetyltransferase (GNAT) domain-containing protein n=1 Tax=Syntrophus gentianae TaxID=43775 RepID=A0A1H7YBI2_9BACT|nr:hypothetical protein SAMN04489760_1158 [Syntrophus gentianae]